MFTVEHGTALGTDQVNPASGVASLLVLHVEGRFRAFGRVIAGRDHVTFDRLFLFVVPIHDVSVIGMVIVSPRAPGVERSCTAQ
jgi:hypothetical protein